METVAGIKGSAKTAIAALVAEWRRRAEELVKEIAAARATTAATALALAPSAEGKATLKSALEKLAPQAVLERIAGACLAQENPDPFSAFGALMAEQSPHEARLMVVRLILAIGGDRLERTIGELIERVDGPRISRADYRAKLAAARRAELDKQIDLARFEAEAAEAGIDLDFWSEITPEAFAAAHGDNTVEAGIARSKRAWLLHAGIAAISERRLEALDRRNGLRVRVNHAQRAGAAVADFGAHLPQGAVLPRRAEELGPLEDEIRRRKAAMAEKAAAEQQGSPGLEEELAKAEADFAELAKEQEAQTQRWRGLKLFVDALVRYAQAQALPGWERLRDANTLAAAGTESSARIDIERRPSPSIRPAVAALSRAADPGAAGYEITDSRYRQ